MQQCAHCGEWYDERLNAGRWQCAYHPGPFDATTRTFQCCGYQPEYMPTLGEPARRGCTAADHDLPVSDGIPSLLLPDRRFYWGVVRVYSIRGSMTGSGIQEAAIWAPPSLLASPAEFAHRLVMDKIAPTQGAADEVAATIIQNCLYDPDYWRGDEGQNHLLRILALVKLKIESLDPAYTLPAWRDPLVSRTVLNVDVILAEFKRLNALYPSSVDLVLASAPFLRMPRLALVARVDWGHPKAELLGGVRLWHQFAELNKLILLSQPHA